MFYTYTNKKCNSYNPTNYPVLIPYITSLSSYYSITGTMNMIAIFGQNFRNYSIINFNSYKPQVIFINSSQINFYIPYTAPAGQYVIQIFNDNLESNVVVFNIEKASN